MNKSIYEYSDYKAYLGDFIRRRPSKGYGFRTRLARVARCNTAYVSQVLNQDAHFSLEQAEDLNELLEHTQYESEYFVLLVGLARAGTPRLKKRIGRQMDRLIDRSQTLKHRVDIKQSLSELDQIRYYSSWHYSAVHILVAISQYQARDAIAARLGISSEKVGNTLEFLLGVGLVVREGDRYKVGLNRIFLGSDSIMISKHHTNWRIKAIEKISADDAAGAGNLHLSTVLSFARKDVTAVKERLIQGIEEARKLVRASEPEEEIFCLGVDFFKL